MTFEFHAALYLPHKLSFSKHAVVADRLRINRPFRQPEEVNCSHLQWEEASIVSFVCRNRADLLPCAGDGGNKNLDCSSLNVIRVTLKWSKVLCDNILI